MSTNDRIILSEIASVAIRAHDRLDFGSDVLNILHEVQLISEAEYVRLGMTRIGSNDIDECHE